MIDRLRQFLRGPWTASKVWTLAGVVVLGVGLIAFIGIERSTDAEKPDCDIWAIEPGEPIPEGC